jgi:3-oxoadipate CoA-transferase beta subunit
MSHTTKDGRPKLLDRCTLPLTGPGVVRRIYTDLAVIDVTPEGFVAREIVAGGTRDSLAALTGAPLKVADDCRVLAAPA